MNQSGKHCDPDFELNNQTIKYRRNPFAWLSYFEWDTPVHHSKS